MLKINGLRLYLHIISQTPNKPDRIRDLHFDNKKQFFRVDFVGEDAYSYIVNGEDASIIYKGKKEIPEAAKEKYKLSKERAKMYRNYFVYLYGMPMKILDPGAHIHDKVERVEFYGMDVLKLKVTYDEAVGKDIWYFYFDPTTFALKAYQFFHDESKNDGEYILFEDEVIEDGIRFPATRKWYYNKDGGFLGADVLKGE